VGNARPPWYLVELNFAANAGRDERITDSKGRTVDFCNTVVVIISLGITHIFLSNPDT
jgi:hypothetical protein